MPDDTRWIQRFSMNKKMLAVLERSITAANERILNEMEEQGLIKGFEFTFELSGNLLKKYLESKGFKDFHGSKDAFKLAFQEGLISDGELRNISNKGFARSDCTQGLSNLRTGQNHGFFGSNRDQVSGIFSLRSRFRDGRGKRNLHTAGPART